MTDEGGWNALKAALAGSWFPWSTQLEHSLRPRSQRRRLVHWFLACLYTHEAGTDFAG